MDRFALVLAILGSALTCGAQILDYVFRRSSGLRRQKLEWLSTFVAFRGNVAPVDNLRQALVVGGAGFLAALSIYEGRAVYIGLQVLLVLSALLWYPTFGARDKSLARLDHWKGGACLLVAVLVWVVLEYLAVCPGFHRIGVAGLELLACGFMLQRALPRDLLCFLGAAVLSVYGALGMVLDPGAVFAHAVWCALNVFYAAWGMANLHDTAINGKYRPRGKHGLVFSVAAGLPTWLEDYLETLPEHLPLDPAELMRVALHILNEQISRKTGGPFAALVINNATGQIVGVGVNRVVPNHDCTAHGEIVALRMADARRETFNFAGTCTLVTTAQMCGMCLTATIWSGVSRVIIGCTAEDTERLTGFDEGAIPTDWQEQLRRRGIEVVEGVMRDEVCAALERYVLQGGFVYNATRTAASA